MITHHLVSCGGAAGKIHNMLTAAQARDVIRIALENPPVQFYRLEDNAGWQIHTRGHTSKLLKVRQ